MPTFPSTQWETIDTNWSWDVNCAELQESELERIGNLYPQLRSTMRLPVNPYVEYRPSEERTPTVDVCEVCHNECRMDYGSRNLWQRNVVLDDGTLVTKWVCADCYYNSYECCNCGSSNIINEVHGAHFIPLSEYEEAYLCDRCADRGLSPNIVECPECHSDVSASRMTYVESVGVVCNRCVTESGSFRYCRSCGYVRVSSFGEENFGSTCNTCLDRHVISNYHSHHGANLKMFGYGVRKIGVELEVEAPDYDFDIESRCRKVRDEFFGSRDKVWFENDGSLNHGIEIISAPMSVAYFRRNFKMFSDSMRYLARNRFKSHNTSTCGLHIHVSREAFGSDRDEQDDAIARAVMIVENYWDDIFKLSRRTSNGITWGKRYGVKDKETVKDIVKAGYSNDRYQAVNVTNEHTVEFRFFRGTLVPGRLMAAVDLIDAIVDASINLSDDEVENRFNFHSSISGFLSEYATPTLRRYFKEKLS